jgi:chromosome segregation ATPase
MDDQSVASFGITDSKKFEVLTNEELAFSSNALNSAEDSHKQLPPRRYSAHSYAVGTSTSSASFGDAASQDQIPRRHVVTGKSSTEKVHNSRSESAAGTTTDPIDMFDNFTQQRRSSTSNSREPDPFESIDAFASNSADLSNLKPPAVQRASQIEEEPSIDDSNKSESVMRDSSGGDRGRTKKSKMQKIGELLAERKNWSLERRILKAKTMTQAEKIARLEKEVKELGESETRAEEMNKLTRDLDKTQKEAKLAKKQLLRKKTELTAKDKELVDNAAEISTLRKELSKALQQVDMLEEELENDKTRILTLTKGLLGADAGTDDYSTDYVETRQEQQEMFERELNKKDLKIESQRLEVNKQAEQILLLKSDLAQAQTLVRKNEVLAEQIADLTEANEAITTELDLKEQELADARKKHAAQNTVHAAKLRELERGRRHSARDLLSTSWTIGRDDESVAALRKDLNATKAALSESQQNIATITSQNVESIAQLQDTIHHLEIEKMELQSKLQQGDPTLKASVNQLQQANQDLERTVLDLERSLDSERKEFEKLESKLNSQISSLRSSLEASQNLHQQSENEAKMGVSGLQAKLSETEMALEEMKLYNEELEASVEELKETSADVEQDFSRLHDEHLELQAKAAKLEEELEKAKKSSEEVQGRLLVIQEQGVALDEKNQRLEREMAQVADENEHLKGNVEDAEGHAAEAQQAVSALEDLMDEYDDLQDEAHALREKVSTLELELVKVKMESREWRASADRAEKHISETRESLAVAAENESQLELLKDESNKFFQDFVQVQKKLEEGHSERDALRKQVREVSVQLEEYVAIVTELEDEQSRVHGIEEEAKRLRDFKQSAELEIYELTCERDKWMESATAVMVGLGANEAEIYDLKNADSEYSVFRAKAAELRTEIDTRRSEMEVIRKERDHFRVAAEIADAELAKARSSLASLDDLMEEYELLQTEADTLQQDKAQLESELKTLRKQKSEVEEASLLQAAKAEVVLAELEALKSQVECHERHTSELALTNADLIGKLAELQSSLDDWKKKAAQAEATSMDASELGDKCVEYQKRIEAMEAIMNGLHENYDEAMLKIQTLEVETANWKSSYEKATSELNEAKGTSQSLEKQLQVERTTLRAEHSKLVAEIGEKNKRDLVRECRCCTCRASAAPSNFLQCR